MGVDEVIQGPERIALIGQNGAEVPTLLNRHRPLGPATTPVGFQNSATGSDRKAQPGTGERDRPRGRELIAASGTGWLGYRR